MPSLRKQFINYVGKLTPGGEQEMKLYRFLLHGQLATTVGEVADLSSLSDREQCDLNLILSEIDIRLFMKLLLYLYDNGLTVYSPLSKTIPYVLAHISKMHKRQKLAYDLGLEIFSRPEEFVLFIKYIRETGPFSDDDQFWDLIENWFKSQDLRTICELIGENQMYEGWSISRVLKMRYRRAPPPPTDELEEPKIKPNAPFRPLIRAPPEEILRHGVIEYVVNGIASLRKNYKRFQDARGMIEYFQMIENFRETPYPTVALRKIMYSRQRYENANEAILEHKYVMNALVKRMDVRQLLALIEYMSDKRFFLNQSQTAWDSSFLYRVSYRLRDAKEIKRIRLHPSESFIAHQRYINKGRSLDESAAENASPTMQVIPVSEDVASALKRQMELSFENIKIIENISIAVVIDPYFLGERFCGPQDCIRTDKAAAFIAATLKKTGRNNVSLYTFEHSEPVKLTEESVSSISEALETKTTREPSSAVTAFVKESSADLVVVIGNSIRQSDYFDIANKNDFKAKIVLCSLTEARVDTNMVHKDVLITKGFNRHTCDIITAFAVFKFFQPPKPLDEKLCFKLNILKSKPRKKC